MAMDCPCGCGRKIARLGKRTTERAVFIASLTDLPEHLAEVYEDSNPADAAMMTTFKEEGQGYFSTMLAFAHTQDARLTLPSARELGDWESAALALMPVVQEADPEWFSQWPGLVRNRVTGKGGG